MAVRKNRKTTKASTEVESNKMEKEESVGQEEVTEKAIVPVQQERSVAVSKDAVRELERSNKELLIRVKELEYEKTVGSEMDQHDIVPSEVAEDSANIINFVKDPHSTTAKSTFKQSYNGKAEENKREAQRQAKQEEQKQEAKRQAIIEEQKREAKRQAIIEEQKQEAQRQAKQEEQKQEAQRQVKREEQRREWEEEKKRWAKKDDEWQKEREKRDKQRHAQEKKFQHEQSQSRKEQNKEKSHSSSHTSTPRLKSKRSVYLDIIGCPLNADMKEIRSAYKKLSMRYHPDRVQPGDGQNTHKESEEMMKKINEAWAYLKKQA
ncbi:MAG: DnaJ domain-containing protein [Planctomycetes bacterium]|nr:DnaJ domain-containing protein [Planctomycetota bacterium]